MTARTLLSESRVTVAREFDAKLDHNFGSSNDHIAGSVRKLGAATK